MDDIYKILREINVAGHVEQKDGLNYLSWAYAWDEIMKNYPNATYEIERFDNKPYLYDEKTGYMVFTKMNINGIEREMWLPVMDSNNKSMLDHAYTYDTKYKKDIKVEPATMFDINKTIMRCLVKNLAMYGLGLALYSGEDLPEEELTEEKAKAFKFEKGKHVGKTILEIQAEDSGYLQWCLDNGKDEKVKEMITMLTGLVKTEIPSEEEQTEKLTLLNRMMELVDKTKTDIEKLLKNYGVKSNVELTIEQLKEANAILEKKVCM